MLDRRLTTENLNYFDPLPNLRAEKIFSYLQERIANKYDFLVNNSKDFAEDFLKNFSNEEFIKQQDQDMFAGSQKKHEEVIESQPTEEKPTS